MIDPNNIDSVEVEASSVSNIHSIDSYKYTEFGNLQTNFVESNLAPETFYKLFTKDFVKTVDYVSFVSLYGDPIFNDNLPEFIKYLADLKVKSNVYTTGGYRTTDWWASLATAYKLRVCFRIDGLDNETVNKTQIGLDYNTAFANMQAYVSAGGMARWEFTVFKHNEHQVEQARQLCLDNNIEFKIKNSTKFRWYKDFKVMKENQLLWNIEPPDNVNYCQEKTGIDEHVPKEMIEFKSFKFQKLNGTDVQCQSQKQRSLYLSSEGYLLPCTHLGTYNYDSPSSIQFNELYSIDDFNINKHSVLDVVEKFKNISGKWNDTVENGNLVTCMQTCGKKKEPRKMPRVTQADVKKLIENTKIDMETKNTFCILPFTHVQVKPSGQIKPCCRFEFQDPRYRVPHEDGGQYSVFNNYNINDGVNLKEALDSDIWQDLRNKMLNNEPVIGCKRCYKEELISGHSMRTYENNLRNNENQTGLDVEMAGTKLKYIEMTFGNYCNLKCRTCNADLSSTWWEDDNALVETGRYPDRSLFIKKGKNINVKFNWTKQDFADCEEIKFTGGEPMIHPDFLRLMDMLIDSDVAKNIKLDIFTNCSWIPGEKYLSRLKQFKKINLSLSIDGLEEVNEYIRHPSKWPEVEKAVDAWLQLENENRERIHVVWNPTINIYNIYTLDKMVNWWFAKNISVNPDWLALTILISSQQKQEELIPSGKFKFNVLHEPSYLSIELLPQEMRSLVIEKMKVLIAKIDRNNERIYKTLLSKILMDDMRNKIYGLPIAVGEAREIRYYVEEFLNSYTPKKLHWIFERLNVKFTSIIDVMQRPSLPVEDKKKFLEYTNHLDKLRDEDFSAIFPKLLREISNEINSNEQDNNGTT